MAKAKREAEEKAKREAEEEARRQERRARREAEAKARRVWTGDGSNPGLASESRRLAVKNMVTVASQRALDRLLSNASCR